MKRALLAVLLLALIAPCLSAQEKTEAGQWLALTPGIKQALVTGFFMGAISASKRVIAVYEDRLARLGHPKSEFKTSGEPVKDQTGDDVEDYVAAMDAFYNRPENANVEWSEAMIVVIFGTEKPAK